MAGDWLGIASSNLDSYCGHSEYPEGNPQPLEEALDGTNLWLHDVSEIHWFILDFGETTMVTKIRARSDTNHDPMRVVVYVSDNKTDWGTHIYDAYSDFDDTVAWVEKDTTHKSGRYMFVKILSTEYQYKLQWGDAPVMTIFDVYGYTGVISNLQCRFTSLLHNITNLTCSVYSYNVDKSAVSLLSRFVVLSQSAANLICRFHSGAGVANLVCRFSPYLASTNLISTITVLNHSSTNLQCSLMSLYVDWWHTSPTTTSWSQEREGIQTG